MRSIKVFDKILLVIVFLVMIARFYLNLTGQAYSTINDLIVFLIFCFGIRLCYFNKSSGFYLLLLIIIPALFNVIKITISGRAGYSTLNIGSFSINPFSFLLLILFILLNREDIKNKHYKLKYGTREEQLDQHKRRIDFYYAKFACQSSVKLEEALKYYKNYPEEARAALDRIKEERNI